MTPSAPTVRREKPFRRALVEHSQELLHTIQFASLLLNLWIGIQFSLFVRYYETGGRSPAIEFADNDYAIGLVMEKLSKSFFAGDALVFVVEDDAQDGPDHVDAHRSVACVVGPYVKHNAVVSERFTTVSVVRTIEALLGRKPSSLYAAAAAPMSEVFDPGQPDRYGTGAGDFADFRAPAAGLDRGEYFSGALAGPRRS